MTKNYFYLLCFLFFWRLSANAQLPGATIDIQHYAVDLQLNDGNNVIKGEARIKLKFLKSAAFFKLDLVKQNQKGEGMLVSNVSENGALLKFEQNNDALSISTTGKEGSEHKYVITYSGIPKDGLIISTNKYGHRTFFGDNWPNRAHNWMPCVDDPADKALVDFIITAPQHYQVVANGIKITEKALPGNLKLTHWKENAPLATKVMVIGVADFAIDHTGDIDNTPVYSYVFPENKIKGFKDYAYAKEIMSYYVNKVGPYPFEKLANVQSKTRFGGLENASAIFYFENSVGDKGVEELMAHEIAHQWFGDAAGEKNFSHLWLSEGFATFMTNVYLEQKYGADSLRKRLKADRDLVINFEKERKTSVVDTTVKGDYMQLLNPNSYQKAGWILHMLNIKVGDIAFWQGIRAYYAKYNGGNANTDDFRMVMEQASGQNLKGFFNQWLYTGGTPLIDIKWQFDNVKKALELTITQNQEAPFEFPLDFMINGNVRTIQIKEKTTQILTTAIEKSATIIVDPNVNLLAQFKISEVK